MHSLPAIAVLNQSYHTLTIIIPTEPTVWWCPQSRNGHVMGWRTIDVLTNRFGYTIKSLDYVSGVCTFS